MTQHTAEHQDLSSQGTERRDFIKQAGSLTALGLLSLAGPGVAAAATRHTPDMSNGADNFYRSEQVNRQRITFKNPYGMRVAGNLFTPKSLDRKVKAAADDGNPNGSGGMLAEIADRRDFRVGDVLAGHGVRSTPVGGRELLDESGRS